MASASCLREKHTAFLRDAASMREKQYTVRYLSPTRTWYSVQSNCAWSPGGLSCLVVALLLIWLPTSSSIRLRYLYTGPMLPVYPLDFSSRKIRVPLKQYGSHLHAIICSLNESILEWYSVRWYTGASVISSSFLTVLREIPRMDAVARLDFVCLYTL